jgi:ABC-type dipeptide/oligopeptide/nickel transport system permease subunit
VITLLGLLLPGLSLGSVIVEKIFAWPGVGRLYFDSILARDYPVVLGLSLLAAVRRSRPRSAADFAYALADPRVRDGRSRRETISDHPDSPPPRCREAPLRRSSSSASSGLSPRLSPLFFGRAAKIRLEERLRPPAANHPFGTDDLGRDLFARVIVATPISLTIGSDAARVSLCVGFAVGGSPATSAARSISLLSRLIEVFLCFPVLFLLMALAAFLPPTPVAVVLAIGLTTWPGDARYARAEVLKVKEPRLTRAARRPLAPRRLAFSSGTSFRACSRRSSSRRPSAWLWAILAEAALSFLGVGLPATPSPGAGSSRPLRATSTRRGGWRSFPASRSS